MDELDALLGRLDDLAGDPGGEPGPGADAAGGMAPAADGRVPVRISLTMGRGPDCRALVVPPSGDKVWYPAERLAAQLGVPVDQLPGMEAFAVVAGGELTGFATS